MYRKFAIAVLIVAPIMVMGAQAFMPRVRPKGQSVAQESARHDMSPQMKSAMSAPPLAFAPPPNPSDFAKPTPGAWQPTVPSSDPDTGAPEPPPGASGNMVDIHY